MQKKNRKIGKTRKKIGNWKMNKMQKKSENWKMKWAKLKKN